MEAKARVENEVLTDADKTYFYTPEEAEDKQLEVYQQVVRITNDYAVTLSLPPVSECAGKTFTVSVDSATAAVTLTDFGGTSYNDSINWEGDFTLDAAEDTIALYSDGRTWHQVDNQIA